MHIAPLKFIAPSAIYKYVDETQYRIIEEKNRTNGSIKNKRKQKKTYSWQVG